jgi:ribulose-phosphate 3-epimerase
MKRIVAPSILAANFLNLGEQIELINNSEAGWIHFDVMDGVFVPNISFGPFILEQVKSITNKPLDVHLMITDPGPYIKTFADAGASNITVHYETCPHLHRTIQSIKNLGLMASVCLNPHTPVDVLDEILPYTDMVLIMSVNPGFGGQTFIESTYTKIGKLRKMIQNRGLDTLIEVDGGVNFETGKKLYDAGANVLVSGSFIFNAEDPVRNIHQMLRL